MTYDCLLQMFEVLPDLKFGSLEYNFLKQMLNTLYDSIYYTLQAEEASSGL